MPSRLGWASAVTGLAILAAGIVGEVQGTAPTHLSRTAELATETQSNGTLAELLLAPLQRTASAPVVQPTLQRPVSLSLPTLNTHAPVVMRVQINGQGLLTAPDDPLQLGWWSAQSGAVVIDGHVGIHHTAGALAEISRLRTNDPLIVENQSRQSLHFRVVSTQSTLKGKLSPEYFTSRYNGWLLLITCGGTFDQTSGHYRSNIVTLARPV